MNEWKHFSHAPTHSLFVVNAPTSIFGLQIDPQFRNETTCRWAHLTHCCWLHADASNPVTTDPTFIASGVVASAPSQNPQGWPIPINDQLLGAEMVLWETQRGPQDKVGFLRLKAPVLAENTYAFGSDTTSFYSSFASTFAALDTQYVDPTPSEKDSLSVNKKKGGIFFE